MDFKRSDRLGEAVKEEISLILLDEIKDPKIGFITITRVKMSEDLRIARVYYSVFGGEKERMRCRDGLERAKGYIKKVLGRRLRTKYIPELIFKFDDSLEYGRHIESLIKGLKGKN